MASGREDSTFARPAVRITGMKTQRLALPLVLFVLLGIPSLSAQDRIRLDLGIGAFELGGSYRSFGTEDALGSLELDSDLGLGEEQEGRGRELCALPGQRGTAPGLMAPVCRQKQQLFLSSPGLTSRLPSEAGRFARYLCSGTHRISPPRW